MTNDSKELLALAEWCRIERERLGAIDGYDYRSGEEFGLRRAQNEIERRSAAAPQPGMRAEGELTEAAAVLAGLFSNLSMNAAENGRRALRTLMQAAGMTILPMVLPAASPADALPPDAEHPTNYREAFAKAALKPAPDAMREALQARVAAYRQNGGKLFSGFTVADELAEIALSAPVPPPDGAVQKQINQNYAASAIGACIAVADELVCVKGSAQDVATALRVRFRTDNVVPPSDDVRSALADAREAIVLTIAFLGRDTGSGRLASTISALISRLAKTDATILAALRSAPGSAPVSAPATGEKS
jgi:hypothetical protein